MLRKYIAKRPCDVMDKLQAAFVRQFKDFIGDGWSSFSWDRNFDAAKQLADWAIRDGKLDFDDGDRRALMFLLENAVALLREEKK